jgi:hypothetical protein
VAAILAAAKVRSEINCRERARRTREPEDYERRKREGSGPEGPELRREEPLFVDWMSEAIPLLMRGFRWLL